MSYLIISVISYPGSFTAIHQDGFGTVDSGHLCLQGANEVVMLRRLPEVHKKNAMHLLYGITDYDPLHELPHGDMLVSTVLAVLTQNEGCLF